VTAFLEAAWVRLRLELIARADGATGSYDADANAGKSEPESPGPRPAGQDIAHFERRWTKAHVAHRNRMAEAQTDGQKRNADAKLRASQRSMLLCRDCADPRAKVGGAIRCCVIGLLRSLMLGTKADPSMNPRTKEWRERIARDPRGDTHHGQRQVGRIYGISEATVRNYRRELRQGGRDK
jgi:hypothetical protein